MKECRNKLVVLIVLACYLLETTEGYPQQRQTNFGCDPCTPEELAYCKPLPSDCLPGIRPCGCCDLCQGKVGSYCAATTPPCMDGLQCVSNSGEIKTEVPWYDFDFHGICMSIFGRKKRDTADTNPLPETLMENEQ